MAQETALRTRHFNTNEHHVMLDGYDPVSYFTGKPQKGIEANAYTYKGVTYWFATPQHKNSFIKHPDAYEPQYGGWCAYALGLKPEKVKVNPTTFKIIDHKLYLFYDFYLTNTLKMWNKDQDNLLSQANKNWQTLIHQ